MRNIRSVMILFIAAAIGLTAVVLVASMIGAKSSTTKIVVAAQTLSMGKTLVASDLKLIAWPNGNIPKSAFTDIKKLEGRLLKENFSADEVIREKDLYPAGSTGGLATVIAPGTRAMTVRVNDVIGVAGFALPGNYVDVIVNTELPNKDTAQRNQSISKIVLEKILVLAVAQEASREETAPKVVDAVTLQVTPEQAEKIDLARSIGKLSLVLRNQLDATGLDTAGATNHSLLNSQPEASRPQVQARKPKPARPVEKNCIRTITGKQIGQECW